LGKVGEEIVETRSLGCPPAMLSRPRRINEKVIKREKERIWLLMRRLERFRQ
jgi:hypothetical protein